MRSIPRHRLALAAAMGGLLLTLCGKPAAAAEYDVPTVFPTIQAAVNAAADSNDVLNFVNLVNTVTFTNHEIDVGPDFGPTRRLTIRPKPARPRATIASQNGFEYILVVHGCSYVTIQDLDLIRYSTNKQNLVGLLDCERVILQRCRIGSNWGSVGPEGYSNLVIDAPVNVVVRNCLFFSYLFGNFDQGVSASLGSGLNNSLFLYNNTSADYRYYGFEIAAHSGDQFVLLRNNVAINRSGVLAEPVGYHSACSDIEVVTSHNTAFAGAANVEVVEAGGISIAGDAASGFLRLTRANAAASFMQTRWDITPIFDPNQDFCRLVVGGPLHDAPADAGQTVEIGSPHARDVEVFDDWERDPRPSGPSAHTDRGADQVRKNDLLLGIWALSVTPNVLIGGGPAGKALVTLTDIVYGPDLTLNLTCTNPAATVPVSVIVPTGSNSASFLVKTTPVTDSKIGSVKAAFAASIKSASVKVRPVYVKKIVLNPTTVKGGSTSTATVSLEIAAPMDTVVYLSSSNIAVATAPASIVILKGSISGTAVISTVAVPALTTVTISAKANGVARSATLTITH